MERKMFEPYLKISEKLTATEYFSDVLASPKIHFFRLKQVMCWSLKTNDSSLTFALLCFALLVQKVQRAAPSKARTWSSPAKAAMSRIL